MYSKLLFFIFFTALINNTFSQEKTPLIIQKSNYSKETPAPPFGINFKISGDKSKIAFLVQNHIEIWDIPSRKILFKKRIENNAVRFGLNYTGNMFYVFKNNSKGLNSSKKQYICELHNIIETKPFLTLNLDIIDIIKFSKNDSKIAIIKNGKIINQTIDFYKRKNNTYNLNYTLKKPNKGMASFIFDLEFSDNEKFVDLFISEDCTKDSPVIFQKRNAQNYSLIEEKKSNEYNHNRVILNMVNNLLPIKRQKLSSKNLKEKILVNNNKNYIELFDFNSRILSKKIHSNTTFLNVKIVNKELIVTLNSDNSISIWNIHSEKLVTRMKPIEIPKTEVELRIEKFLKTKKPIKTLKIANIAVNEKRNEIYFSIREKKEIKIWNYERNSIEDFETDILPVKFPFFTSDSTIVYKKGNYIEHYNFKKLKVIDCLKEEHNDLRNFDFKYDYDSGLGLIKTRGELKILKINPLEVKDSIKIKTLRPPPLSDEVYASKKFKHIAIVENPGISIHQHEILNNEGELDIDHFQKSIQKYTNLPNPSQKYNNWLENAYSCDINLYELNNKLNITREKWKYRKVQIPKYAVSSVSFSEDNEKMIVNSFNVKNGDIFEGNIIWSTYIYDFTSKSLKRILKNIKGCSWFNPFSKTIISINEINDTYNIEVRVYKDFKSDNDLKITSLYSIEKKEFEVFQSIKFLNESEILIYGKTNTILINLKTGNKKFLDTGFSHLDVNKKNSLIVSNNISLNFYSKNFKKIYSNYFHKDMKSSLIINENLNYWNFKRGGDLVSLLKNNRIYNFEQFDLKHNRPDIVIESIKETLGDSIINNKELYKLAYKKRLERINKKEEELESGFHTPELTIINKALIPNKTNNSTININIKALDNLYNLEKLQLSVNGVIIKNLTNKLISKKEFSTIVPLKLSNGKNKILISVINEKGISSFKEELNIEYVGLKEISNLFIVSLGVSKYQYLNNTPNSSKDAYTLTEAFKKTSSNTIKRLTLTDNQVTKNSIKQISAFLSQAKENDVILFFVSGHALLKENEYFFCTSNSSLKNITETGINYNDFDELLGNTKSRNRLLILNTCYSGEIFNASTIKEIEAINLMRTVFEDLKLTNGTTVISASEGTNKYYESNTKGNGLITLSILNLINSKKEITVEEFCNEIIQYCTIQNQKDPFNNKLQKNIPLVRHNNIYNNFRIW